MIGLNLINRPVARFALLSGLGLLLTAVPVSAQGMGVGGSQGGNSQGNSNSGGITNPFGQSSSTSPGGSAQSYNQGLFGGISGNVVGPTSANPFQSYYVNPYSIGAPQQQKTGGGGNQPTSGTTNAKPSFGVSNNYVNSTGSTSTGNSFGSGTSGSGLGGTKTGGTSGSTGLGSSSSSFGSTSSGLGGNKSGTSGLGGTSSSFGSGNKGLGSTSSFGGTGMGGTGTGGTGTSQGFTTIGTQKTSPSYITVPGGNLPVGAPPTPGSLHFKVSQLVQLSSKLPSRDNIQVGMNGQTVVLSGNVLDNHEKLLAEGIIRLTPGVKNVVNNLVVQGSSGP